MVFPYKSENRGAGNMTKYMKRLEDIVGRPDPDEVDLSDFHAVSEIIPHGMKIIGQHFGIFECAQMLTGYENFCLMLYDDPGLIEDIFERLGPVYETMYKKMSSVSGVGAVVISDDLGFKTNTLISAEDIRKHILPLHKKQADIIHDAGKPCIYHSCGQLASVMEDMIDYVGIDAKHSFEDNIMPATEAVRSYGDRIAILGGADVGVLCGCTEDEVRAYVGNIISAVGNNGGYALGSGNSITSYMPVNNYLVMLEEERRSRR
jgi:uroporphyrinogen decarboxylase